MDADIKLKSNDGTEFTLNRKNALLSNFLKVILEGSEIQDPIEIKEADKNSLSLIIEFLNHYAGEHPKEIEKPIKSTILKEFLDDWSIEFLEKIDTDSIVNLTVATNYMEIQSLLDLVCTKVAVLCKDKTDEEILSTFKIKESFSEEEKAKIREENKWIEENL